MFIETYIPSFYPINLQDSRNQKTSLQGVQGSEIQASLLS